MVFRFVLRKLYHTTALSSEFALDTSGGSAWSGKLLSARLTRSRTSFAAASMSRESLNSMVMSERPLREVEVTFFIPSIPDILSSNSWVIRVSTILADAPV